MSTEKEWLDNISGAPWDDETKRCAVAQMRKAGLRSFGRIPADFELRMHPEDCGCGAGAPTAVPTATAAPSGATTERQDSDSTARVTALLAELRELAAAPADLLDVATRCTLRDGLVTKLMLHVQSTEFSVTQLMVVLGLLKNSHEQTLLNEADLAKLNAAAAATPTAGGTKVAASVQPGNAVQPARSEASTEASAEKSVPDPLRAENVTRVKTRLLYTAASGEETLFEVYNAVAGLEDNFQDMNLCVPQWEEVLSSHAVDFHGVSMTCQPGQCVCTVTFFYMHARAHVRRAAVSALAMSGASAFLGRWHSLGHSVAFLRAFPTHSLRVRMHSLRIPCAFLAHSLGGLTPLCEHPSIEEHNRKLAEPIRFSPLSVSLSLPSPPALRVADGPSHSIIALALVLAHLRSLPLTAMLSSPPGR